MIAQLPKTATHPSPDQLYSAGYRDGQRSRKNSQFATNSAYLDGFIAGYRSREDALFNIPLASESLLERGWGDELLNAI